MYKLYIYLLVLLFFVPFTLMGQGFKGKVLTVTPHVSGFYLGDNESLMNNVIIANLDFEKVLNRSISIGIKTFRNIHSQPMSWFSPNGTINGRFSGYGYGFFLRKYFFNRGAIAPLGTFIQIAASRNIYDIVDAQERDVARLKTFAAATAIGLNWFLGKNVLLFSALEFKLEGSINRNGTSKNLHYSFNDEVRENLPVAIKLGITIPLI